MKFKLSEKTTRKLGRAGLRIKANSPELLIGVGIVGVVTATVMACKASTKFESVIDETKGQLDAMRTFAEKNGYSEEWTEKDHQKDTTIVYGKAAIKLMKLYAPALIVGGVSIGCILQSHRILNKRNAGLAAAYTALDKSFGDYRKRVVEKLGEEADKEFKYGLHKEKVEVTETNEKGKEKKVKKEYDNVVDPSDISVYAKFYDSGCRGWTKDPNANLIFLKSQQAVASDKLKARGYLFLDEVYKMLGIPVTPESRMVGWVYDEEGETDSDNFVDFGIYDVNKGANRRFVNGLEKTILLDFNVVPILDKFYVFRKDFD